ncbi:CapA family protein [Treponema socranskii]|uniref:CapA family protein n=1 Tax=Treponema socranskii TaxID=53419 RepID=UPI0020A4143C|nr:CapA family protein [Treponema socranskii]
MMYPKKIRAIFFALASLFFIALALRAFRPARLFVRVSDALYESYKAEFEAVQSEKPSFRFIKESENMRPSFFGAVPVTIGRISERTEVPIAKEARSENEVYYLLSETELLPSVKADFTNDGTPQASLLSPDASVSFSEAASMPEGNRALPVDGVYAGSEGYALSVKRYAVCVSYDKRYAEKFTALCKALFAPKNASACKTIFVASVGDIMVARGVQEILIDRPDGLETVFGNTLSVLQKNDITIGNLEGVVTSSKNNAVKTYTFRFDERVLPHLKDAGFDYLMQANNHSYDFGEEGFKDTLAAFEKYGIPTSGAGRNADEAKKFYHKTVGDTTFAIISCGAFPVERSGFNGKTTATATDTRAGILWQSDELLESIKKEKDAGAFVIVNVHGGEEYRFTPTQSQRRLYEALCSAGADVVFGSHPHVLQSVEWYGKSLIVYSLGNFLFNGMEGMPGATESEIVRLGIVDKRIAYCEIYKAELKGKTVTLKRRTDAVK